MKFKDWLFESTKSQFFELADMQRDAPEEAMLKVQMATRGSVMNPVVESIGDLIHRMTEQPTFQSAGYNFVKEKVERCLRYMKREYGFGREFIENLENNAKLLKINPQEFKSNVFLSLEQYAKEHEKLPTYNRAQKLAQLAAISLGRLKFQTTVQCLEMLNNHLKSAKEWVKFAHEGLEECVNNESIEPDQSFQYFGYYFPSINKAKKIAKKYPVETITPTEDMMGGFVNVDDSYSKSTDLSKPVIFATILAEGKLYSILIDGHHRLRKALDTKQPLLAVSLNLKDSISLMMPNFMTAAIKKQAKRLKLL